VTKGKGTSRKFLIPKRERDELHDKYLLTGGRHDAWRKGEIDVLCECYDETGHQRYTSEDIVELIYKYGGYGARRTVRSMRHRARELRKDGILPPAAMGRYANKRDEE
jgi:hypothetical protein